MQMRAGRALRPAALAVLWLISVPSTVAASERSEENGLRTLAEVNAVLEGRVVRVEFGEGLTVRRARNVRMEPDFTYWQEKGRQEQAPTQEIRRITLRRKWSVLKCIGVGLAAGAVLGASGIGTSEDTGTYLDPVGDAANFGAWLLVGGLGGGVVGAAVGRGSGRVVYEEPLDRYLETTER
jgi:hypothetical protein